ncbi:hypothetical protein [Rhodococcus sovatensis]|uniref:Cell wall synthesis protein Wag31 n=1 Tax=Rhodococcus sovatensis TaxID=1805840 RepID=A0ABZ2PEX6_9NOCA
MTVSNLELPFDVQRRGYATQQVQDYVRRLHTKFERNISKIDQQQTHIDKLERELDELRSQLAAATVERDQISSEFEELTQKSTDDRAEAKLAREKLATALASPMTAPQISARLEQILILAEQEAAQISLQAAAERKDAQAESQKILAEATRAAAECHAAAEADVRQVYSDRDKLMSELTTISQQLSALVAGGEASTTEENDVEEKADTRGH